MTRIAILGIGSIAQHMGETLTLMHNAGEDVELYAAASRSPERAQRFADRFDVPAVYDSYEDMLEDPQVDLVYIATPHSLHAEQMLLCLRHGKAVLCEKAFTANAVQAQEVLSLSEETNILVTEALWTRYMPMRRMIYDLVWSGIVGMPKNLTAGLNYVTAAKPRITDPALAGGSLLDLGIYPISFAESLFGRPDRVQAACTLFPSGVDDDDFILFTYKDGRTAMLTAGSTARNDRRGVIACTEGYIVVENINNPSSCEVYDTSDQLIKSIHAPAQLTGYEYEVRAALNALNDHVFECVEMPHEETLHLMTLMDSIRLQMGIRYPFE
jgi:predicted dehydrogenase